MPLRPSSDSACQRPLIPCRTLFRELHFKRWRSTFPGLRQRRRLHPRRLSTLDACTMRVLQTCARRLPLGSYAIWKVAMGYDLENLTTSSSGRGRPGACLLIGRGMLRGFAAFQLIKSSSPKRRFIQVFKEKSFGFCTGLVIVLTNLFELTHEPES